MSVNNGSALALGRTPHGVRGLKFFQDFTVEKIDGRRTPHGVRGLK